MKALDLAMVGRPISFRVNHGTTGMYEYDIPDMSCGHCVTAVTRAIKAADPEATADVDLMKRKALVSSVVDPKAIAAAIDEAGYPSTFRTV